MKIYAIIILLCLNPIIIAAPGFQIQDKIGNSISLDEINLPTQFSWQDIDGIDFTTPIRDQSPYPSCETFAITAALETMIQYKVGFPFGCDLSEAHLYFYSGGNVDWGSLPENDTNMLIEHGIPDEACWPYPKEFKQYPLNTTAVNWMNRTAKISNWYYLEEDIDIIKNALINNGPVPTYFQVFDDFLKYKQGIYRHRWGDYRGIHYVCIMGWNDDPGYWIIKNSWGPEYQNEGWFNIAYGECSIEKKSFYLDGIYGQYPIVYVDDDNTFGPWDGSSNNPYQTIQQGIDHAYEGWTVFVKNGVYNEHVLINKTINLKGESKFFTIIDGDSTGHVITISKPHVIISGFTIQNSGKRPFEAGIKTLSLYSNATIQDNIIQNNRIGVFLNYAYTEDYEKSSWNVIHNNLFTQNNDGLYIHWSNNNEITSNVFRDNSDDGIEMEASKYSQVENNIFEENKGYGLYLRAASHQNNITHNDFINHNTHVYFDGSLKNKWQGNYWDDSNWIILKPIKGQIDIYDIPWINFDLFPSLEPNNN